MHTLFNDLFFFKVQTINPGNRYRFAKNCNQNGKTSSKAIQQIEEIKTTLKWTIKGQGSL